MIEELRIRYFEKEIKCFLLIYIHLLIGICHLLCRGRIPLELGSIFL